MRFLIIAYILVILGSGSGITIWVWRRNLRQRFLSLFLVAISGIVALTMYAMDFEFVMMIWGATVMVATMINYSIRGRRENFIAFRVECPEHGVDGPVLASIHLAKVGIPYGFVWSKGRAALLAEVAECEDCRKLALQIGHAARISSDMDEGGNVELTWFDLTGSQTAMTAMHFQSDGQICVDPLRMM